MGNKRGHPSNYKNFPTTSSRLMPGSSVARLMRSNRHDRLKGDWQNKAPLSSAFQITLVELLSRYYCQARDENHLLFNFK
jgi:hypothetical protein